MSRKDSSNVISDFYLTRPKSKHLTFRNGIIYYVRNEIISMFTLIKLWKVKVFHCITFPVGDDNNIC